MKVLDLRCANGHRFEGWFASQGDFLDQNGRGHLECPLCADKVVTRMPSAPRLNLSGAREVVAAPVPPPAAPPAARPAALAATTPGVPAVPADLQAVWLGAVRELMARTDDVGERFAEEARRIHYGEAPERGIRGQATADERAALREEGIETVSLPMPRALNGPVH